MSVARSRLEAGVRAVDRGGGDRVAREVSECAVGRVGGCVIGDAGVEGSGLLPAECDRERLGARVPGDGGVGAGTARAAAGERGSG